MWPLENCWCLMVENKYNYRMWAKINKNCAYVNSNYYNKTVLRPEDEQYSLNESVIFADNVVFKYFEYAS